MAQGNNVYDPQADEERQPVGDANSNQTAPGRVSYGHTPPTGAAGMNSATNPYAQSVGGGPLDRDTLQDAEENPDDQEDGLYNPNGDQTGSSVGGATSNTGEGGPDPKRASQASLRRAESGVGGLSAASGTGNGSDESLYNPAGDSGGLAAFRRVRGKASNLKAKALKNKLLVGGVIGGGTSIVLILLLLLLFIGGYKVVDFAEHVAAYQFARTTAQMAENTTNITEEKIGIDEAAAAADNASSNSIIRQTWDAFKTKAKIDVVGTKTNELWSKFDKYRPQKIISNFQNDGKLTFNRGTTKLGRSYINSVTIKDPETGADLTSQLETKSFTTSLKNNFIPGYKFVTRDVAFSRNFAPDLIQALEADNIGPITRARIASQIRQELDIGLVAWITGRFAGKDPETADALVEQDAYNVAEGNPINSNVTSTGSVAGSTTSTSTGSAGGSTNSTIDAVAQKAKAAENTEVSSLAKIKKNILPDTNALPDSVQSVLATLKDSALTLGGVLSKAIGIINPIYKIAVPLCLVYDGSLSQSGPSMNAQSAQTERTGMFVQTAAAQTKDGTNVTATAVGAMAWKLGNITPSYAEQLASGQSIDTSSYASTEASATQQYSIADVGLPSPLNGIVNSLGRPACPALTNLWVGAALGGVNIAVSLVVGALTGGEGDVGIAGGEAAAETAADEAVPSLAARVLTKITNGGSKLKDFGFKTAKSLALIGGATMLAKAIVASHISAVHNSLSTGTPYDNAAFCGTNIYANQLNQQEFYGAPMTDANLATDNAASKAQLAAKESRQSAFQRYASISNPNSLVSRVALMASGYLGGSTLSSLPRLSGALLDPLRSIGFALNPFISNSAFAAATVTSANTYCGNVQFGYTATEKNLMNTNPTYKPIENQAILDQSGKESEIASKYGKCFTESIGTMLSSGDLKRNNSGDVLLDNSLCSPKNLGPNNPQYGDLVFRWRVAQGYNNTLDQLGQMQGTAS